MTQVYQRKTRSRDHRRHLRQVLTPAEERLWQAIRRGVCDGATVQRKAWVEPVTRGEGGIGCLVDFWIPSRLLAVQVTTPEVPALPIRTMRYSEQEILADYDRVCFEISLICASVGEAWHVPGIRWGGPLTAPGLTYRVEPDGQPFPIACDTRAANTVLQQQARRTLRRAA